MVTGTRPLSGLRVLDLTRFVSGSYATALLAGLGADVVKVEPLDGDPYREQGTRRLGDQAVLFLSLNSGKRSLAVDFRHPDGRAVLERLLGCSDFLVENTRPGRLSAHGLDYEAVHRRHPALVYGSISGYGEIGPDAERGGFDLVLQADSGLMSLTGAAASGPVKVGAPVLDIGAGITCVMGLLAAHLARQITGSGELVCTSLFEFGLSSLTSVAADVLSGGVPPGLLGNHSPMFAPYGSFRTGDGWLILAGAGSEDLWHRACGVLGAPHLKDDPRFADNAARVGHRDELTVEIERLLAGEGTKGWLRRFAAAGVPATEVKDLAEVLGGPQVAALGAVQTLDHATAGDYRVLGPPVRFGHGPSPAAGPAPVLGADTEAVLAQLGYTEGEVGELLERGVAASA